MPTKPPIASIDDSTPKPYQVRVALTELLGTLAPAVQPYWLGAKPVAELELITLRHLGREIERSFETPALQAPAGGRLCHGFVVYSGGRETPSDKRTG